MKKVITSLICLQLVCMPAFSTELLQDSLVEQTLTGKGLKINKPNPSLIQDIFAEKTLNSVQVSPCSNKTLIDDELVSKNLSEKKYIIQKQENVTITDTLADTTLKNIQIKTKKSNLNFDFEQIKQIPVKITVTENITSKDNLTEGQELNFRVVNDVSLNKNITLKKNDIITAKLETISLNQAFGVPADIIIDDFKTISNNSEIVFAGNIHKIGANRSLWVYPIGYTTGILFFGAGFLLFTVRGGHAKVKTNQIYEVYYEPKSNQL